MSSRVTWQHGNDQASAPAPGPATQRSVAHDLRSGLRSHLVTWQLFSPTGPCLAHQHRPRAPRGHSPNARSVLLVEIAPDTWPSATWPSAPEEKPVEGT